MENKVLFSGTPAALVPPLEHGFPDECVKLESIAKSYSEKKA